MGLAGTTRLLIAAVGLILAVCTPAGAQFGPDLGRDEAQTANSLVKVSFLADVGHATPGATFNLAVVFEIEPQWHIYWKNAGDAGAPTQIKVTGPEGWTIGEVQYPRPKVFHEEEGDTFGYEKAAVLYIPVTPPDVFESMDRTFTAEIDFLVCKDICLIGDMTKSFEFKLQMDAGTTPRHLRLVQEHKNRLPKPLKTSNLSTVSFDGERLHITGMAGLAEGVQFFPLDMPGVSYGEADVRAQAGRFELSIPVEINENNTQGKQVVLEGLVALGDKPDDPAYTVKYIPDLASGPADGADEGTAPSPVR